MYDDVYIYVPQTNEIIRIAEGTGDNLLAEDKKEGFVDYIYYEQYALEQDFPEVDGGQIMLKEYFQDKFSRTEDAIPYVLDMAYDEKDLTFLCIKGNKRKNLDQKETVKEELIGALILLGRESIEEFLGYKYKTKFPNEEIEAMIDEKDNQELTEAYHKYVASMKMIRPESLRQIARFLDEEKIPNPTEYHMEESEYDLVNWYQDVKKDMLGTEEIPFQKGKVLRIPEGVIIWIL